jgi:hypothetical protein
MSELTTIEMHQIIGGTLPDVLPPLTPSISLLLALEALAQQQQQNFLHWLQRFAD